MDLVAHNMYGGVVCPWYLSTRWQCVKDMLEVAGKDNHSKGVLALLLESGDVGGGMEVGE